MATLRSVFRSTVLAAATAAGAVASAPAIAADESAAPLADGSGLRAPGEAPWPRWQGRLGLTTPLPAAGPSAMPVLPRLGGEIGILAQQSVSLLGDYYFVQQGSLDAGSRYGGGFRATGGLLLGHRATPWSAVLPSGGPAALGSGFSIERRQLHDGGLGSDGGDLGGVPYLGVGYTGLRSLRATGGGWAFSADVGVMALQPNSAFRLGQQAISETLRELQFSPLLQVGVSYSF